MTAILTLAGILIVSLAGLLKGADYFLLGAKALGVRLGLSSFIIGVLIVGFGTSIPELASSIAAALADQTEVVVANVVGSNITNILLIVGLLVFIGGKIIIKRNLLQTELPLFFIATAHFLASVYDGHVDRVEALLLLGTFIAYLWYLLSDDEVAEAATEEEGEKQMSLLRIWVYLLGGVAAVIIGAHFTVDSLIGIGELTGVPIGVLSILGLAIGTSLPELVVSLQSIRGGGTELAIGNIFGSNSFNALLVIGVPALIQPLTAGPEVMQLGLMIMLVASGIFFVSGLTQRFMRFEGLMFLLFFGFFLAKMFAFV